MEASAGEKLVAPPAGTCMFAATEVARVTLPNGKNPAGLILPFRSFRYREVSCPTLIS